MTIEELAEAVEQLPSVLDGEHEIKIAESLQKFTPSEIREHPEPFFSILAHLEESHVMGGIFDVTPANRSHFEAFSNWLESITNFFNDDKKQLELRSIAAVFRTNFFVRQ